MPCKKNILILFTLFLGAAPVTGPAFAQDAQPDTAIESSSGTSIDILPAKSFNGAEFTATAHDATTHPPVKLTPDKSQLLRLDEEVGTVLIGNPNHLSVLAENSKTLVLVGKYPGATSLTALDRKGNVLMNRQIIVASPSENYVRIRQSCAKAGNDSCQTTRVYYCPDMCHEIMINSDTEKVDNSDAYKQDTTRPAPQNDAPDLDPAETP